MKGSMTDKTNSSSRNLHFQCLQQRTQCSSPKVASVDSGSIDFRSLLLVHVSLIYFMTSKVPVDHMFVEFLSICYDDMNHYLTHMIHPNTVNSAQKTNITLVLVMVALFYR